MSGLRFDDFIHENATWEQLRRPFITVLSNLDAELREIRKDLHNIRTRLDVLEKRGKFVDGVWGRIGDMAFKVSVTILSVALLAKTGLNAIGS